MKQLRKLAAVLTLSSPLTVCVVVMYISGAPWWMPPAFFLGTLVFVLCILGIHSLWVWALEEIDK